MAEWDKQPDETGRAYGGFCSYRDMEPQLRSVDAAWRQQNASTGAAGKPRAPRHWWEWYERWDWKRRAELQDADRERRRRDVSEAKGLQELVEHRDRMRQISVSLQRNAIAGLQKTAAAIARIEPEDLADVKALAQFMRAQAAVAEAAGNAESQALAVDDLLKLLDHGERQS